MSKSIKESIDVSARYDPELATSGFQKALRQDWVRGLQNIKFKERENMREREWMCEAKAGKFASVRRCCIPTPQSSLSMQQRPAGSQWESCIKWMQNSTQTAASFQDTYESLESSYFPCLILWWQQPPFYRVQPYMDVRGIYAQTQVLCWIRANGTDDINMWEPDSRDVIESWTKNQ